MKKWKQIGALNFKYKKDTIVYFKKILNSYKRKEALNEEDFQDVMNLLAIHPNAEEKIGAGIKEIIVDEIRYKTKCFNAIRTDSSCVVFSYLKCINGSLSPLAKFNKTCRDVIAEDLRNVKLSFFKQNSIKGKVKCQETQELSSWEELNIDHRQPNTFSVIIDRFIEFLTKIDGAQNILSAEILRKGTQSFDTHNLEKLAEQCGLLANGNEKETREILSFCTKMIEWIGRYPVPLSSDKDFVSRDTLPKVMFNHYFRDIFDPFLDDVFKRLESEQSCSSLPEAALRPPPGS